MISTGGTPTAHMAEAQPLTELAKEVNQSERCQEIYHLLVPQVLKVANVRIQVTHDNMFPPQEAVDHLLNIHNVIKSGRGGGTLQ